MSTHATTKFRWTYLTSTGKLLQGNFFVPIGKEKLAEEWVKKTVSSELEKDEHFDLSMCSLVDFGSDHKMR